MIKQYDVYYITYYYLQPVLVNFFVEYVSAMDYRKAWSLPQYEEHTQTAQQGGKVVEAAREQLEGKDSVISLLNVKNGLRLAVKNKMKE